MFEFEATRLLEDASTPARRARCLLILGFCLFITGVLKAQTPDPSPTDAPQPGVRPPLGPFPTYEDWSFLRDPAKRVDPYDRLKFIPLNDSRTINFTLGLEDRTEFQYLNSNDWGAGPQDHTGYLTDFRDAVNRVRNTAWAAYQYTESKITGKDSKTIWKPPMCICKPVS